MDTNRKRILPKLVIDTIDNNFEQFEFGEQSDKESYNSFSGIESLSNSFHSEENYDSFYSGSLSYFSFDDQKEEEVETKESKVDIIADQIIKTFIVKKQKNWIDLDTQEDVVSYEESEKRLITLCQVLASILMSTLWTLFVLTYIHFDYELQSIINKIELVSEDLTFPVPQVVLMDAEGIGEMIVLRLNNQNKFEFAWDFKVPKLKRNSGYFLFTKQKDIFLVYSDLKKAITVIHGPSKHNTITNRSS